MKKHSRYLEANRRRWDESVALHMASAHYPVRALHRGALTIHRLESEELGPVRRKSLLHLQCHFGLDSLSWARLGARVTGVDFSPEAVKRARALAAECGIAADFVESDVYNLPRRLHRTFDVVYTAKGVLCWLPDIRRWARVVARLLRPVAHSTSWKTTRPRMRMTAVRPDPRRGDGSSSSPTFTALVHSAGSPVIRTRPVGRR